MATTQGASTCNLALHYIIMTSYALTYIIVCRSADNAGYAGNATK